MCVTEGESAKKKGIYMREREKVCVCVKEQKSKERGS
jgi:hypothetical protein